ncbi:hypothetical protein DSO57_1017738 [Entomophthora muscae]|uniref:Uncharacterized protein n=2 Tax=Entomophthora muscae TaxID=34485 RepID=A0ACC2UE57_9FUNG|nr:hypothetical protein DSO57_1017738 [Entomophthora muscae]
MSESRSKMYEELNAQLIKLNENMGNLETVMSKTASQAKDAQSLSHVFAGMFMAAQQTLNATENEESS